MVRVDGSSVPLYLFHGDFEQTLELHYIFKLYLSCMCECLFELDGRICISSHCFLPHSNNVTVIDIIYATYDELQSRAQEKISNF